VRAGTTDLTPRVPDPTTAARKGRVGADGGRGASADRRPMKEPGLEHG
jgi:hypothetical protein